MVSHVKKIEEHRQKFADFKKEHVTELAQKMKVAVERFEGVKSQYESLAGSCTILKKRVSKIEQSSVYFFFYM